MHTCDYYSKLYKMLLNTFLFRCTCVSQHRGKCIIAIMNNCMTEIKEIFSAGDLLYTSVWNIPMQWNGISNIIEVMSERFPD